MSQAHVLHASPCIDSQGREVIPELLPIRHRLVGLRLRLFRGGKKKAGWH
jgi:hypothetical protein